MARSCVCQCTKTSNSPRGCVNGVVGRNDPKKLLCDVCYYEANTVSQIRRKPTDCTYPNKPPSALDRIIRR
ncbi:uncharacterized protein PG998_011956 [Apiospora kogelbergensis]|uniref:Uncharacterized protein n=1 Tax=Apiospora kogelbergensis TaxID=1337665 RepID=A0AAW0QNS3_9PEZI